MAINAKRDINQRGSDVGAANDIELTAGRNINIDAARESVLTEQIREKECNGLGVSINHNYANTKDAVSGSGKGEDNVSKGSSTLKAGRDINLKASNDLNLIGTQAKAQRDIELNAGNDLSIRSAHNDSNSENNRHSGGGEAGLTFGSEGIGVYVSVSMGKGNLEREGQALPDADADALGGKGRGQEKCTPEEG